MGQWLLRDCEGAAVLRMSGVLVESCAIPSIPR